MQTNTVARESDSGSLNQPVAGEKADKSSAHSHGRAAF